MRRKLILSFLLLALCLVPVTYSSAANIFNAIDDTINGQPDEEYVEDPNIGLFDAFEQGMESGVDEEVMDEYVPKITSKFGTVISVVIYLIFIFTGLTTIIDLLWIALPPVRPYLYSPDTNSNNQGFNNTTNQGFNNSNSQGFNNQGFNNPNSRGFNNTTNQQIK